MTRAKALYESLWTGHNTTSDNLLANNAELSEEDVPDVFFWHHAFPSGDSVVQYIRRENEEVRASVTWFFDNVGLDYIRAYFPGTPTTHDVEVIAIAAGLE